MKLERIENFTRGWFVGNFEPTVLKTEQFEVGILTHKKGEEPPCHYHTATEINYVISGKMVMNKQLLVEGDIFIMEPYEIADPEFLTDCVILVVKTPSLPGDKYLAEKPKKLRG